MRSFEAEAATGSCWAMVPMTPARARARATVTLVAWWPRATRWRERWPSLTWACQLLS